MNRDKKKYLLSGILAAAAVAAVSLSFFASAKTEEKETIPEGVYIGEISVGGMTKEEAAQKVEEAVAKLQEKKITFHAGENELEITAGELGVSWGNPEIVEEAAGIGKRGNLIVRYKELKDLEQEDKVYQITYRIDEEKAARLLTDQKEILNTEAVNASLERKDGSFLITPGKQGIEVNIEKSVEKTEEFFRKEWEENDASIELVADITDPKGTQEELEKVKNLLGTFHTSYASSNAGRRQNVENGTSKINGTLIYPEEEISVYEITSPYVKENGYGIGGAYENGKVIESYGGGICQVSTTLYNAVIRAELQVTERYPHSMTVSYVDPSEDAAIAGTYKDFKFKNNTGAPVYIEGYTSGEDVYFNVYGQETRPENRQVRFESEVLTTTDPGVRYQAVVDQPIGYISVEQTEHVGYTARLWKIVTIDGVEQEREVFNTSTYKPSERIVSVGIASGNGEAAAAMNAAIATQDENTIRAAAAQWNEGALQAAAQAAAEQAAAEQAAAEQAAQEKEREEEAKKKEQEEEKPKDEKPKDEKPEEDNSEKDDAKEDGSEKTDSE
ncbi:MAG: hypothetical protein HFH41_00045 [Lachnospiraceae bacterium]|nr:hypothetical protein [Lachnospiraceae bacterium]